MSARTLGLSTAIALSLVVASVGCSTSEVSLLTEDASENARVYARECDERAADSCFALAIMYEMGDDGFQGVHTDREHAASLYERACRLGSEAGCLAVENGGALVAPEMLIPPVAP